ncbi:transposase [Aurantimonas aggregata]|uniref:Transposase n=1 Tax=Aurantimonas aggregata TaxID=2047720 RepID=A0A6L9MNC1_9HYPH|nr:transposase [Aurantimonas aggregata]NDV89454.1 transposase [Aurantimonas aggregata]
MGSHKHNSFERLEIVETGRRRRRWSEDEKLRIVMESLAGPRRVAATARRHGISRWQLSTWRRTFRAERHGAPPEPAFVPAVIVPPLESVTEDTGAAIVVDLPGGGRMLISASTPPALAAAVLKALR